MKYIVEYQASKGLTPDGILGKQTAKTLADDLGIEDIFSLSHFLGQLHHESGGFKAGRENLNYGEDALRRMFSKYFKESEYKEFDRHPSKIANRIYANRMGNKYEQSGDGWTYRE